MANFFSSPWFLDAAARIMFAGEGVRPGFVEVEGRCYRLLLHPNGTPARIPLADYVEPLPVGDGPFGTARVVPFLPRVASRLVALSDAGLPTGASTLAPRVDWRCFDSFQAFVKQSAGRSRNAFKRHRRKLTKLGDEVGPTRVSLHEPDHGLLEAALSWKSSQFRRNQRPDRFASRRNRQLVHLLVEQGRLQLAVLFAGERPLSVVIGHDDGESFTAWITSYDASFARYSPGILLFESLMEVSWERGHRSFDFLSGAEPYKLNYATHAWVVGDQGRPPLTRRLELGARRWIRDPREHSGPRAAAFHAACLLTELHLARQEQADLGRRAPWMERIERNQRCWPHGCCGPGGTSGGTLGQG